MSIESELRIFCLRLTNRRKLQSSLVAGVSGMGGGSLREVETKRETAVLPPVTAALFCILLLPLVNTCAAAAVWHVFDNWEYRIVPLPLLPPLLLPPPASVFFRIRHTYT